MMKTYSRVVSWLVFPVLLFAFAGTPAIAAPGDGARPSPCLRILELFTKDRTAVETREALDGIVRDTVSHITPRPIESRRSSLETYDVARQFWAQALGVGTSRRPTPEEIMALVREPGRASPESLMALVDVMNPLAEGGFRAQIAAIEAQGGTVHLRTFRFPERFGPRDSSWEWDWSPRLPREGTYWRRRIPILNWFRDRHLIIDHANVAPQTPQELVEWVFHLSQTFAYHRVLQVGSRSNLISLPFGSSRYSFPREVLEEMRQAEIHIYSTLHTLERMFPDIQPAIPETDRVWRWNQAQFVLEVMLRPLYPYYHPEHRWRPNRQAYTRFLTDLANPDRTGFPELTQLEVNHYQSRLRLKWFADRYLLAFRGLLYAGLGLSAVNIYQFFNDGQLQQLQDEQDELLRNLGRERQRQILEEYRNNTEGDPLVNAFYNEQIEALEQRIRNEGDRSGALRRQIEELIRLRNSLRN